jgi:hypothetical protein
MTVSSFAVTYDKAMTKAELKEALLGQDPGNDYTGYDDGYGIIDAYKNVSPEQMKAFEEFQAALAASSLYKVDDAGWDEILPSDLPVSKEDAATLVLGIAKLLTYAVGDDNNKLDKTSYESYFYSDLNSVLDKNLDTAIDYFYDGVEGEESAYDVLNYMANGKMNKKALGGLIIDLKNRLIEYLKAHPTEVSPIYANADANDYIDANMEIMKSVIGAALDEPRSDNLAAAKVELKSNGLVTDSNNANSALTKIFLAVFDLIKAVDSTSEASAVALDTIAVSILDMRANRGASVTYPNGLITLAAAGTTSAIIIPADEIFANLGLGTIDFTSWLDYNKNLKNGINVTYKDGKFVLTANNSSTSNQIFDVWQIYRQTDTDNGNANETDELFMEIGVLVNPASGGNGGGGGGGSQTTKPVTIEYVDESGNTIKKDKPSGKTYTFPEAPEKDGYNFTGWTSNGKPVTIDDINKLNELTGKERAQYLKDKFGTDTDTITLEPTYVKKAALIMDDHFAYIIGYPEGDFRPLGNITRAEVATIFSRLTNEKIFVNSSEPSRFSDVPDDEWYSGYVKNMEKLGIISGYEDGTFKPDQPITRAEFATVASKFAELTGDKTIDFSDIDGHWAVKYINLAVSNGWIIGYEDGTFRPDQNIVREEVVTIVNRMTKRIADKEYIEAHISELVDYWDINNTMWSYYEVIEASNAHDFNEDTKTDTTETWTGIRPINY